MSKVNMQAFHPNGQDFAIDPVCGMEVDPKNPPFQVLVQEQKYYFCSQACKFLFEREPGKYVDDEQG